MTQANSPLPPGIGGPLQGSAAPPGAASPPGQNMAQAIPADPGFGGFTPNEDVVPVTEFIGTYIKKDWEPSPFRDNNGQVRMRHVLHFEDCVVLNSDEPYPYKTVKLNFNHSERMNSFWGIFCDDLRELHGHATADEFQATGGFVPGTRLWMCIQQERVLWGNPRKREINIQNCWRAISLFAEGDTEPTFGEGVFNTDKEPTGGYSKEPFPDTPASPVVGQTQVPTSGLDRALELLHSKTAAEFMAAAMADPTVTADAAVMMQINGQTFINTQIAAGRVGENQGRFYKIN